MESFKYGDDRGGHPQTNEYGLIGNVTHWMPLPEPPQESHRIMQSYFRKYRLAAECHAIASELDVGGERNRDVRNIQCAAQSLSAWLRHSGRGE